MRTIPSDTITMVPSFLAVALVSRSPIRCLMSALISDGFSCCIALYLSLFKVQSSYFLGKKTSTHFFKLIKRRIIYHLVACTHNYTSSKLWVYFTGYADCCVKPFCQLVRKNLFLCSSQWDCCFHHNTPSIVIL